MFFYLNSTINPIIYNVMSEKYRKAFHVTFCRNSIRYLLQKVFSRESDSTIANVFGGCGYIKSWVWLYWKWCGYIRLKSKPLSLSESSQSAIVHIYWSLRYLLAILPIIYHANLPSCTPPQKKAIMPISNYSYQPPWPISHHGPPWHGA